MDSDASGAPGPPAEQVEGDQRGESVQDLAEEELGPLVLRVLEEGRPARSCSTICP
jgi:hypothetical protein